VENMGRCGYYSEPSGHKRSSMGFIPAWPESASKSLPISLRGTPIDMYCRPTLLYTQKMPSASWKLLIPSDLAHT
jgi:hypothetical protein